MEDLVPYQSALADIRDMIAAARLSAYRAASTAMILAYWSVGKRIVEQEQAGENRAEYGKHLISALADALTKEFGKGFSERNLHYYRKFYMLFPDEAIWQARLPNLTWSHFSCSAPRRTGTSQGIPSSTITSGCLCPSI